MDVHRCCVCFSSHILCSLFSESLASNFSIVYTVSSFCLIIYYVFFIFSLFYFTFHVSLVECPPSNVVILKPHINSKCNFALGQGPHKMYKVAEHSKERETWSCILQ